MQKLLILFLMSASLGSYAQGGAKKPATAKPGVKSSKTAVTRPVLKNPTDSFSYAIGVSIANFYKEQGITNINSSLITKGFSDCSSGKPGLNESEVNNVIMAYMQKVRSEKSSGTRKAGEAFLAENKKKPGIVTTASGLQYMILKEGTGPKPAVTDKVKVHYHGTLIDGTVFDSSVERGEPIELMIGQVIPGWVEALPMMPVGSKWRLFIPSNLAYGDSDAGPVIKAGSTLIFEVELLDILK